jgi:hypothetical protein
VSEQGKRSDTACFACWSILAGVNYSRGKPIPDTQLAEEVGRLAGKFIDTGNCTIWDTIGAGLWSIVKNLSPDATAIKGTDNHVFDDTDSNLTNEVISYEEE